METHEKNFLPPVNSEFKIAVIGLGYVGLPLACLFSKKYPTVGFDVKCQRIEELNRGYDYCREISTEDLKSAFDSGRLKCTSDREDIKDCNFYVVAVPTPIDENQLPDMSILFAASATVGKVISPGNIVVFESSVYPGATEEECVPIIEKSSGLRYGTQFYAGYSPERVNPADKVHTIEKIVKVTSGCNPEVAEIIDSVYRSVLKNGTFKAASIKVAEACKVIENAQRDLNIAFFNQIAKIFNALGIRTGDVIDAASSKWNFINLRPGLVGGHCISVDPYYLIDKSIKAGVVPDLLVTAREINESMGGYVSDRTMGIMRQKGTPVENADVLILGVTFKENCPDVRNTKVADIYYAFRNHTSHIDVVDVWANKEEVEQGYNIKVDNTPLSELHGKYDAVILAVAHSEFLKYNIRSLLKNPDKGVVYDVKGVLAPGIADACL